MPAPLPPALGHLLDAGADTREDRWTKFVDAYSRLILHACRSIGGDHDAAMDRYAFVLEQLRRDECRRLRTFVADGRSEFSTWLVVVTQRLCRDHERHRYGRVRSGDGDPARSDAEQASRRRLVDLIGAEVDLSSLADDENRDSESIVRLADIYEALQSAMAQLSVRDRLLIKLRFEDALPMPDVAVTLGFPTRFHAYRRLNEVLERLRRSLEAQGFLEATP